MKGRRKYTLEQLECAVANSFCWSDVIRLLGLTLCTTNVTSVKRAAVDNNISFEHFSLSVAFKRNKVDGVFCQNSKVQRSSLRKACIKQGLYKGTCDQCGTPDIWLGEKLTLDLDHINGDCFDNRKENLRWLCPNCHSQTETFRKSTNRAAPLA